MFVLGSGSAAAQNVLVNPGFATSLAGWTVESGVSAGWSPLDIAGSAASGSALVTNSSDVAGFSGGLTQCVSVVRGVPIAFRLRYRIPSGLANAAKVQGAVDYFSGSSCEGDAAGGFGNGTAAITSGFDAWGDFPVGTGVVPPGVASALVGVRLVKVAAGGIVQAYFDEPSLASVATVTIPASASIHGQNGTFFQTDLWVLGSSWLSDTTVTARHRCFASQNCGGSNRAFHVAPRQSVYFTDALVTLFGDPGTAGAIELSYDTSTRITVGSRTYSPSLPAPTTGTSVPALASDDARTRAVLVGLSSSGGDLSQGFRSNVGVYNPGSSAVSVTITLHGSPGTTLGAPVPLTLAANEARQVNDVFLAAGTASTLTRNAYAVVTSSAPVFSYATVIDNQSQDSVFIAGADDGP
ncbi:MAG TPA: hypothetical protein VLJ18_00930 [Thermoanaerobaculia bacterium]|nr:hypothetical protein [Thermoanaerobaculia bacterium]